MTGEGIATDSGAPWRRLHPLTPVVTLFRFAPAILIAAIPDLRGGDHSESLEYIGIAAAVLAALSLVSVFVTRWRFDGEVLTITTGLLRRDERRLPVTRIQAVDLVRPFIARGLGLAEVRVRLAGAGGTRGRIAFLTLDDATRLRARLLAAHHGLDESTPEPEERVLLAVPFGRLLGAILITDLGIMSIAVVVIVVVLMFVSPSVLLAIVGGGVSVLLGLGQRLLGRISSEYGFIAAEATDGLRVRSGLFQTSAETIPFGRIQAVREVEPLLWRPFGWSRLEVDVAGGVASRRGGRGRRAAVQITKTLLPVGAAADAEMLRARVLGTTDARLERPPTRARAKAPLGYHFLAAGTDDRHAVTVSGRLRKTTAWVPFEKVQSIRRTQGPIQRSLRLATVHLDTAGRRVHAMFKDRDEDDASSTMAMLVERCRTARLGQSRSTAPG